MVWHAAPGGQSPRNDFLSEWQIFNLDLAESAHRELTQGVLESFDLSSVAVYQMNGLLAELLQQVHALILNCSVCLDEY